MAIAAGTTHADGSHKPAVHQSASVAADAQVPEPGWRCPTPKNVAMVQEMRDLGVTTGDEVINVGIATVTKKGS
jgi:hypothetical protein